MSHTNHIIWQILYDSYRLSHCRPYIFLTYIKNYCSVAATRTLFQEEFIQDPELFRCPESHTFLSLINVVYVGATNILLLNLLIAMFTYSFDRVQTNTAGDMDRWNTLKYSLIKEYHHKSPIIAPFRKVLKLLYLKLRSLIVKCACHGFNGSTTFKIGKVFSKAFIS